MKHENCQNDSGEAVMIGTAKASIEINGWRYFEIFSGVLYAFNPSVSTSNKVTPPHDVEIKYIEHLQIENKRLREALSKVATNIGNGSMAAPSASLDFLCDSVPNEVELQCSAYRKEIQFAITSLKQIAFLVAEKGQTLSLGGCQAIAEKTLKVLTQK